MSEDEAGQVTATATPAQEAAAGGEPPADVRERHAELSQELGEHQYRYYVLDRPTVDDASTTG